MMRVALVAPPWRPLPVEAYGGVERIVYALGRQLAQRGHEVTVFCREGSRPDGFRIAELFPASLSSDGQAPGDDSYALMYERRVYRELGFGRFDVLHEHSNHGILQASIASLDCPVVATVHDVMSEAQIAFLAEVHDDVHLVASSRAQRRTAAGVRIRAAIHNAVTESELSFSPEKDDYFVQVARIRPEKGQHLAIEIAKRVGAPLVLAGNVDKNHRSYFETEIRPRLGPEVTWIPDVGGRRKADLLARARAMLFPIQWDEPFGLAMVEAMANGTPVIAPARGAVRELIEPGVTGLIAADADEFVEAIGYLGSIEPATCARRARERFSERRMAISYEQVYLEAIRDRREAPGNSLAAARLRDDHA
jgi:glycosyltransferase involved in cell wall biosynthesis